MTSSATIAARLADAKSTDDVDSVIWQLVKNGDVPDFIAKNFWKWVTIKGGGHTLEILTPGYFAVGDDDDPWWVSRTSETIAQDIADRYNAVLPTWKMLREIQKASDPKIPYIDVKAHGIPLNEIETHRADVVANDLIGKEYEKRGIAPGDRLVATWAKAFVTHENMDGSHLCIGGGSWDSSGTSYVQDPCSPHVVSYGDASQRILLVSRKGRLDGEDVDIVDDVAKSKDPAIRALIFDAGQKFDLSFPNAGSGSAKKMAMSVANAGAETIFGADLKTAAGRATVAKNAGGTGAGAIVGVAVGLMFRLSPWGTVGSAVAGAVAGRLFGGKLLGAS